MLISTKGRYALRVLLDLAEHGGEQYVPLKEIAERQEISEKYLENILRILVKGNILKGLRGKGGGYRFISTPDSYTIEAILSLTEETLAPVACLESTENTCSRKDRCRTLTLWTGLNQVIIDYLSQITLADLLKQDETKETLGLDGTHTD